MGRNKFSSPITAREYSLSEEKSYRLGYTPKYKNYRHMKQKQRNTEIYEATMGKRKQEIVHNLRKRLESGSQTVLPTNIKIKHTLDIEACFDPLLDSSRRETPSRPKVLPLKAEEFESQSSNDIYGTDESGKLARSGNNCMLPHDTAKDK